MGLRQFYLLSVFLPQSFRDTEYGSVGDSCNGPNDPCAVPFPADEAPGEIPLKFSFTANAPDASAAAIQTASVILRSERLIPFLIVFLRSVVSIGIFVFALLLVRRPDGKDDSAADQRQKQDARADIDPHSAGRSLLQRRAPDRILRGLFAGLRLLRRAIRNRGRRRSADRRSDIGDRVGDVPDLIAVDGAEAIFTVPFPVFCLSLVFLHKSVFSLQVELHKNC